MSYSSLFLVVSDAQLGSPPSFTPLMPCVCMCFSGKRTFLTRISLLYLALQHGRPCKLTLLVTDECQDQSTDLCHLLQSKELPIPSHLTHLAEQKVGGVVCLGEGGGEGVDLSKPWMVFYCTGAFQETDTALPFSEGIWTLQVRATLFGSLFMLRANFWSPPQ